jgi:hypothetical protein
VSEIILPDFGHQPDHNSCIYQFFLYLKASVNLRLRQWMQVITSLSEVAPWRIWTCVLWSGPMER